MKHTKTAGVVLGVVAFAAAGVASAHVIVKPSTAGIGSVTTFSMGVPSETDQATTAVRLMLPDGLQEVQADIVPGWQVSVKTGTDADDVTEIDWTGGNIPSGEREEFMFNAQVPAQPTTLEWKAYQTYADGNVVSWDETPTANMPDDDAALTGPYSTTAVVDDLAPVSTHTTDQTARTLAIVALLFSILALARSGRAIRERVTPVSK